MANTFGHLFRIAPGESHGGGIGSSWTVCPPRIKLQESDIQPDLDRRRPGQSGMSVRARRVIGSRFCRGTFLKGRHSARRSVCWFENEDARPELIPKWPRNSGPPMRLYLFAKIWNPELQGGGKQRTRTVGRVPPARLQKGVREHYGVERAGLCEASAGHRSEIDPEQVQFKGIESNIVRCPTRPAE